MLTDAEMVGGGSSCSITTAVQTALSLAVGSFCEVAVMVISSCVCGAAFCGMVKLRVTPWDAVEATCEVVDGAVRLQAWLSLMLMS